MSIGTGTENDPYRLIGDIGTANTNEDLNNSIDYQELEDLPAPELWLNPDVKDFFEFDNSKDLKDIKVLKYQHHGKISFPIAQ